MNRRNITKRIFITMLTVMCVFSLFIVTVSADIVWYTDEYILVGNENYTVNQTMNFSYREHTSEYLLLNHTHYNLSSPDTINITLDYLHENISNTTSDDLVLGFYVNISGSTDNVWFNLSGFTSGYSYTVYRENVLYDTVVANSSGVISFSNSDWAPTNPLFRVFNNEGVTWHSESFGGVVYVDVGVSIIITNDGEFDADHYVFRGTGTANDPYIIENLTATNISITGPNEGSPITKYFKIQNITIINEIKIQNTSDNVAHIHDVHTANITNKSISFYYSNGVTVENCTFTNHTSYTSYGAVALIRNNSNSVIRNCTFIGNDTADPPGDKEVRGISLGGVGMDNILIDNCNLTEQCIGIRSQGTNVVYRDCYFYNNTDEGIFTYYGQFLIENCEFAGVNYYDMGIEFAASLTTKTDGIIRNCTFDACYDGIAFTGSNTNHGNITNTIIHNCTFTSLSNRAVSLKQVDNVTMSNCTINNSHTGIILHYESNSDVGVRDCTFLNTTITNTTYGVTFSNDKQILDNLFYNNYFADNTEHIHEYPAYPLSADNQTWNTTKTLGTNIISGPYLGGNYWDNYTGYDTDDDGLGDTDVPFMGLDNLPLCYIGGATWYSSSFGGSVTVSEGEAVWYSSNFGGSVVITEEGVTWYSSSFGGSVSLEGFGNWSEYWKIGQTIIYDCTDPLDLIINTDDINVTINNLTLTGANGWILADVNDDGVINYLDISGVCFYYPWNYGE